MNVFVSRANKIGKEFAKGLEIFLVKLKNLGLEGRTLGATDFGSKSPLDQVIAVLEKCNGAVILGYPQIEIEKGSLKGEPLTSPILLPTEWNHIEAGLAYARKLPLLVVCHIGVVRGIFDRGAMNSFQFSRDLTDPAWSTSSEIDGALMSWRDEVLGFSVTPTMERGSAYGAIQQKLDSVWTIESLGRRILDPRPAAGHRERGECRIQELTEFYVRVSMLGSGAMVSIPMNDIVISYDDERRRPMIQLRG